tara:strand:+ start:1699 stop:1893 length:195 start_codon:yes stop_codon:yes gene_type:complete
MKLIHIEKIIAILLMTLVIVLMNINIKLKSIHNYQDQYLKADWCSSEIEILRLQIDELHTKIIE